MADKVNVGNEIYLIETRITQSGETLKAEQLVEKRERETRARRWEVQDEQEGYTASQLDRSIVNLDQIRTVVRTFRDKWPEIFVGRDELPKTLIFAKTDSHADDIVQTVRQEFGKGNDFCRKITNAARSPKSSLAAFRNEYDPRIAVTHRCRARSEAAARPDQAAGQPRPTQRCHGRLRRGALIASVYLSGTNTRRVNRALFGLFRGAVSKYVVSRAWRKVKVDWDAWCSRGLADEDIVRLILDGTVIKTRLDRKATNISVLAAIGVRRDGQKVLLSIGNMGGESQAAWRQFLDDLDARGLKRPGFVIVDGAPGLEAALSALWGDDLPVQRCTVHKHRNLLGHAPKHMHERAERRLPRYDLCRHCLRGGNPPQGVCPQVAAEMQGRRGQPRRSGATSSLPSRACPRANGNQPERPTPLSVSTRSSSAGSKHRPCCRVPNQCRCSSGRSSLPAKSRCAKSMDGKPSIS